MGRHDDRVALISNEAQEHAHELASSQWIKGGEWFVEEKKLWTLGQTQREGDLRLLADRERADSGVEGDPQIGEMAKGHSLVPVRIEAPAHTEHLLHSKEAVERALLIEVADAT